MEQKIGRINESTHAALHASDLPAYLWPKVYMNMCHTQNSGPSSALQRKLKKKEKERLEQMMKDAEEAVGGEGVSAPGEQGRLRPRPLLSRMRYL